MEATLEEAQSLRMMKAFYNVHDQDARKLLIHLAESAERGMPIVTAMTGLQDDT
jgi:hypothetical protein